MKKLFLLLFSLAGSTVAVNAQTKLVIVPAAGTAETAVGVGEISKITFGGDKITVEKTDETQLPFDLAQIASIKFDDTPTSIGGVVSDGTLRLYMRNGMLCADGLDAVNTAKAVVYDAEGKTVLVVANWNGAPLSTSSLPKGVYVFAVGGQTVKFSK